MIVYDRSGFPVTNDWLKRENCGFINRTDLISGELNTTNGEVKLDSATYVTSDFIPVVAGIAYRLQKSYIACAYASDKTFSATISDKSHWLCPDGVAFVRITATIANKDTAQIIEYDLIGQPDIKGFVYTGITDDSDVVIRKAISDFASDNNLYFTESENLFDYEKDWVQCSQGQKGINSSTGEFIPNTNDTGEFIAGNAITPVKYFPISEGQTLTANVGILSGAYYNSDKEYIGAIGVMSSNPGWVCPAGCAYVRLNLFGISSEEDLKKVTVKTITYSVPNARAEKIQNPVPKYQINGLQISHNYLDKVVPSMVDSSFLSAMKCLAIREANEREHAFRIGNFNMYVGNATRGWDLTKKMLMDYGCDFCGFEEVNTSGGELGAFLQSWQFPYAFLTNKTDGGTVLDKAFVSRFPISSSEKKYYQYNSEDIGYLNCKIALPRLLDVYNPFRTLSVYVVHLSITTSSYKANIASQILATIASDSSDYVIIFGDMNDMGTTEETKTYWRAFEASGFRPVLPITSKTITQDSLTVGSEDPSEKWREMALDQFCVSSNIDIKRYGVVNTKDGYGDASVQTIDDTPCLSDHDFVWCDLVFKDETRTAG